jgi:hypothetical protein
MTPPAAPAAQKKSCVIRTLNLMNGAKAGVPTRERDAFLALADIGRG